MISSAATIFRVQLSANPSSSATSTTLPLSLVGAGAAQFGDLADLIGTSILVNGVAKLVSAVNNGTKSVTIPSTTFTTAQIVLMERKIVFTKPVKKLLFACYPTNEESGMVSGNIRYGWTAGCTVDGGNYASLPDGSQKSVDMMGPVPGALYVRASSLANIVLFVERWD